MTAAGRGPRDERDRDVGRLVGDAYATRVGIDAAARHLWAVDREARRLRRRRRHQRLVSAAASIVLLVAGVGTVTGSATALPGEPLYPVKAGLERAELTMAVSEGASARAHVRHSRARLRELEQAAETNPEVVPELAERFFESLNHAAAAGGDDVAADVAALRTIGSSLMDQLVHELDPDVARLLAEARGIPDSVAMPDADGAQAAAGGPPAGGEGRGTTPAEPMGSPPETAVAEVGDDDEAVDGADADEADDAEGDDGAAAPDEPAEETGTAETPPETTVAEPDEPIEETGTVQTPPESASAGADVGSDDEAAPESDADASAGEGDTSADGDGGKRPDRDELQDMVEGHHEE